MASVVYKSLSTLSPIELKYEFNREEKLDATINEYQDGFSFYEAKGLELFQDVAINRDSCFILTSSVVLSTVFTAPEEFTVGKYPVSVKLQPRNSEIYYIKHSSVSNTLQLALTSASNFYIQPLTDNTELVEIFVDGKYLQVNEYYPYTLFLSDKSLDPESIHRQRFIVTYQDGIATIKTLTNSGYRYLAFNDDNKLRAVGLILNDSVINDYVFKCIPITETKLVRGFEPQNNWVTYYYDIESGANNKNVIINKDIKTTPVNLLIDFPLENAASTGIGTINIANLKTSITPAGGPAPIDNSYDKKVITTN